MLGIPAHHSVSDCCRYEDFAGAFHKVYPVSLYKLTFATNSCHLWGLDQEDMPETKSLIREVEDAGRDLESEHDSWWISCVMSWRHWKLAADWFLWRGLDEAKTSESLDFLHSVLGGGCFKDPHNSSARTSSLGSFRKVKRGKQFSLLRIFMLFNWWFWQTSWMTKFYNQSWRTVISPPMLAALSDLHGASAMDGSKGKLANGLKA